MFSQHGIYTINFLSVALKYPKVPNSASNKTVEKIMKKNEIKYNFWERISMNQIKKVVTEMANNVRKLRKDMKDADKKTTFLF